MPGPQFALRMKLSRQRSDSRMVQLSKISVAFPGSRMAASISQKLRGETASGRRAGIRSGRSAAKAARAACSIRSLSVPG